MKKVVVLGAGISGLSASIGIARSGVPVEVFEQNAFVGSACGENVQAIRNYDLENGFYNFLKKIGLSLKNMAPIKEIVKYAPSGRSMSVHGNSNPLFYVVKRGNSHESIDVQLYEKALDEGVIFHFNKKKNIKAANIVAVNSIYKNIWAYGAVFKGVNVDPEKILFFMDNRFAPQGYIYIVPYGKHEISIASTSFDLNCALPVLFEKFTKKNPIIRELIKSASFSNYFSGYAYSNVPQRAEINHKKFVGSAAGFIDAARGFGVKYALESGYLASKAISEKKNYDALWKASFGNELLESLRRRFFLERLTNKDLEKFILGEEVNIKTYRKIPSALSGILADFEFSLELSKWQKRFDLNKLFS